MASDGPVEVHEPFSIRALPDEEHLDRATSARHGQHRRVRVRRDVDGPGAGEKLFGVALQGGNGTTFSPRSPPKSCPGRKDRTGSVLRGGSLYRASMIVERAVLADVDAVADSKLARCNSICALPSLFKSANSFWNHFCSVHAPYLISTNDGEHPPHVFEAGQLRVGKEGRRVVDLDE
jgi:hypothetical protein